jgi:type III pantothenate kinase
MSPLLLIDAGNTRLKWATAAPDKKIRSRGDAPTAGVTAARIKALAREFPEHRAVLACVVPRLLPFFRRAFGKRLFILTGSSPALPISFIYPNPAELGADRLAAAIAAQAEGRWPVIIVSCGTASAFTVLDGRGRLCGGVIAPGLQTQLTALLGAAAQLPATPLRPPRRLPARSTREAIRAGILLSFQGGVREIVARLRQSLPARPAPKLLLTGGDARHLRTVFGSGAELRPLLVFEGLRIMGSRIFPA